MKYIYCFRNLDNGKKYIGSTIKDPQRRYSEHMYYVNHTDSIKSRYPLYNAIRKHGIDRFEFTVLRTLSDDCDEQHLRELEREYIVQNNSLIPNGYNQTLDTAHPINDRNAYRKISETKRTNAKEVVMSDLDGNPITQFRSAADCAEIMELDLSKIGACCRGERHQLEGYRFFYLDENGNVIIPVKNTYQGAPGTTQIQSSSKKVAKIDLNTGEYLDYYDTIALAARENHCDASAISKVCKGKRSQAGGYYWEYVNN